MTTQSKGGSPKAPAKSRRVFPVGQCHHRDAKGVPDCKAKIVAKRANLCPPHEKVWQAAARKRYAANRAARGQTPATTTATTSKKAAADEPVEAEVTAPEAGEDLEAQLAASVSAFATPELAAKARAKRQSQRSQR